MFDAELYDLFVTFEHSCWQFQWSCVVCFLCLIQAGRTARSSHIHLLKIQDRSRAKESHRHMVTRPCIELLSWDRGVIASIMLHVWTSFQWMEWTPIRPHGAYMWGCTAQEISWPFPGRRCRGVGCLSDVPTQMFSDSKTIHFLPKSTGMWADGWMCQLSNGMDILNRFDTRTRTERSTWSSHV